MKAPVFVPRFGHYKGPLGNLQPEPAPLELRDVHRLLTGLTLREPTARLQVPQRVARPRKPPKTHCPRSRGPGFSCPTGPTRTLPGFHAACY
jgi:hypothetical protein